MKKYLCLLIILLFSCNNNDENKIAIVIHGGAGVILKEDISKSKEDSIINKLNEAALEYISTAHLSITGPT